MMLTERIKNPYLLLTPGPLSTSDSVRAAMNFDSCTWDDDYKTIVTDIRRRLLSIANCDPAQYTTVLMQGSGSFGVEAILGSSIDRKKHRLLILSNGLYGQRMVEMATILELPHLVYQVLEDETFDLDQIKQLLEKEKTITHIAIVHCETTTGLLNDLRGIAQLAHEYQKHFIVDAMSSFGGIEFDITELHIDFLVSSANKCIQGVPGFSFSICQTNKLIELCQHQAKSLVLNVYGQWKEMEKDPGKWRYTSPTHTVLAFHQSLIELEQEGGIAARAKRYHENQRLLSEGMKKLGFMPYIAADLQSPIITTFIQPENVPTTTHPFVFNDFYYYLKDHGFVIYPGKITNRNSFRIGTIGHLFSDDMKRFLGHVKSFIEQYQRHYA